MAKPDAQLFNDLDLNIDEAPFKPQYNYEGESWPKYLGRVAATGVAHAPDVLGVPGTIAEWAASKTAGKPTEIPFVPTLETMKKGREAFAEKFLPDKEYLEGKDIPSKVATFVGGDLPFIIASGGTGVIRSIARSLGSGASMVGAEKLGLGPIGQLVAGFLGGGATEFIPKKGGGAVHGMETLTEFGEKAREAGYSKAHGFGAKVHLPANKISMDVNKTVMDARKNLTAKEYKDLLQEVNMMDLDRGTMSGSDLLSSRKKINRLIDEAKSPDQARAYMEIKKTISGGMDRVKQLSKGFAKHVGESDKLHDALSNQWKLRKWLNKSAALDKTSPMTKLILMGPGALGAGIGAYSGGLGTAVQGAAIGAAAGTAGMLAGRVSEAALRGIELSAKSPIIAKHLGNIMKSVGKNQMKQIPFNIAKLDAEIKKLSGNGIPYTLEDWQPQNKAS
jgi:hypothetical protein